MSLVEHQFYAPDIAAKAVIELTTGGVHHSFEALGMTKTAEQAFDMLRRGGTANIIGMIPVGTKIELHGVDFLAERKIQGSMMGSNQFRTDIPRMIDMYLSGRLLLDEMVSATITMAMMTTMQVAVSWYWNSFMLPTNSKPMPPAPTMPSTVAWRRLVSKR